MPRNCFRILALTASVAVTWCAIGALAQDDVPPTNDLPDPYPITIAPWGQLPQGMTWGALNAVAIDNDGASVWVASRCGANPDIPPGESPYAYDSCAGSDVAPVMKFDSSGHLLKRFGAGMFIFPHKIYLDRDDNVWVVDARSANARERAQHPDEKPKGQVVVKFSPEGKVLMTLGTPGLAGDPPHALTEPTSVVTAANGDIFVAEGHAGQYPGQGPASVARISRFTREGKFIASFGRWGAGPGEFKTPHDIVLDARGRLLVADRGNMRIQIFDQDGTYRAQWKQFGRPSGLYIRDGLLYVADSESNGLDFAAHPGWKRGIRIGSVEDGTVLYRIPDPLEMKGTSAAEGLAVDASGNVYGAEVGPRQLVKHIKSQQAN